jgi:phenylalanyl-tRNA synthetase beta chain
MKVSYNWLNTFFDNKLPSVDTVVEKLTFHSWEVEDVVKVGDDTVFDVKILPDRSAYALSHRGIAKDLSVILNQPLTRDPLIPSDYLLATANNLIVSTLSDNCRRYQAVEIKNVKVGPSPLWLKLRLEAIGQKSINNIVDATNYVMFDLGQPLHAFDADKLTSTAGTKKISVRAAKADEEIITLTGESYKLNHHDLLITDGVSDTPIAIAGIKGGKVAEVDQYTTNIILESANFNPVTTRRTSQKIKLRTDASTRYENNIEPVVTEFGLVSAVKLILELAGGEVVDSASTPYVPSTKEPVTISLKKLNSVLGLNLTEAEVTNIFNRFGYTYQVTANTFIVTPPPERNDLLISEDLIEEVGRIYGYDHVVAVTPPLFTSTEVNKRFYYSEVVREVLVSHGFSEVYTSSFRHLDQVKLLNAFASDKGYLRSALTPNLLDALKRNIANQDLLGIPFVGLFEIGTVFTEAGETFSLAFGVRHGMDYKIKSDLPILENVAMATNDALGVNLNWQEKEGIMECDFGLLLNSLPKPDSYLRRQSKPIITYASFSAYPAMSRDIALWVSEGVSTLSVEEILKEKAGALCVRISKFDEFTKEGKTSYAFRLVFQSNEKTLTDEEVNVIMNDIYLGVSERGWSVR